MKAHARSRARTTAWYAALPARVAAALLALCACALAQDWQQLEHAPTPVWPRDHGAHPAARTEWWYATGEVVDEDGRAFGFQWTIFRQGLASAPSPSQPLQVFAAHLAVLDIDAGRMRFAQRVRRATGGLAFADATDLRAWVEGFEIARVAGAGDGALTLRADDREQGLALALTLTAEKALVTHGDDGLSRKGPEPGNASVYTSWTRMTVSGTLACDGARRSVRGTAWFDHEWGTSQLGPGVVGWDWLGLRLADGRELMLYRLRDAEQRTQPESAATLIAADGTVLHLTHAAFELTTSGTWKSPHSGALYPARLHVSVPAHGLELEIVPRVPDCELDARASTGVRYWEGPVRVAGSVAGSGYAELTGYAGALTGRL